MEENDLLILFTNIQSLPKTRRGSKNFDVTQLILDMKFDHIKLSETSRHWTYLQEEDTIPQRFQGNFMSQKLDPITACNQHEPFIGPFKYRVTDCLSTGNIKGRKTSSGRDPTGLGIWSWQKFRVQ